MKKALAALCLSTILLGVSGAQELPDAPKPFLQSKLRRAMLINDFAARSLDGVTSYIAFNSSCRCFSEDTPGLYVVNQNGFGAQAYALTVATGAAAASMWMYHRSLTSERHARAWSRLAWIAPLADGVMEDVVVAHNTVVLYKQRSSRFTRPENSVPRREPRGGDDWVSQSQNRKELNSEKPYLVAAAGTK